MSEFEDLKGKIIKRLWVDESGQSESNDQVFIELTTGQKFVMNHYQDCCENVYVDEIIGDIDDIIGKEILQAEESSSDNKTPPGIEPPEFFESYTWTFYRLNTINSTLVIRWYGESDGYYSEGVDFDEVEPEEPEGPEEPKGEPSIQPGGFWDMVDKADKEQMERMLSAQRFTNKNIYVYNGHFGIDEAWGPGGAAVKMKITKLADLEGKEIKRFWTKIHAPGIVLFELVNGERHYVVGDTFLYRDINIIIAPGHPRPGFMEDPTFHFKFID